MNFEVDFSNIKSSRSWNESSESWCYVFEDISEISNAVRDKTLRTNSGSSSEFSFRFLNPYLSEFKVFKLFKIQKTR